MTTLLTLWRDSIPLLIDDDDEMPILLDTLTEKKKLWPATDLGEMFGEGVRRERLFTSSSSDHRQIL